MMHTAEVQSLVDMVVQAMKSGAWRQKIYGNTRVKSSPGLEKITEEDIICETWMTSNANALLISAAPDLYEALEDICAQFGEFEAGPFSTKAGQKARAALAKARGEETS